MALRRTLLDRQDLIQIGADDFVKEKYRRTRGEWWVRATAEECTRLCILAGKRGQPGKLTQKVGALPAKKRNRRMLRGMIWL